MENNLKMGEDSASTDEVSEEVELSWEELGLTEQSLAAVKRLKFATPTEVQQKSIPLVKQGKDVIVQAKTGSGKTLAFGLPILEKIDSTKGYVQALVLSPTRELAVQVSEEIRNAGSLGNKHVVSIFGGASIQAQINRLKSGVEIVVGTPGRIFDHINRGTLKLDKCAMVVLDEADEMLDRGFLDDVMDILEYTPKAKQTMMFSATMPTAIKNLAKRYQNEPEILQIGKAGLSINYDIEHSYYKVSKMHKFVSLVNVLHTIPRSKVLIFCNMKSDTESVAEHLYDEGFAVGFLSGDLSQAVRTRTLNMFKENIIDILVATDVAARGIDIEGISHVINYNVPDNKELYVHRTGRTGRAGRKGKAITLVAPVDLLGIGTVSRNMGMKFDKFEVPTKEDVAAKLKETFIGRLKAMEQDGYPDDLSILADELLEDIEPYTAVAGLLTFLRQRGWELEHGYDPDNPEHKQQNFVRPVLLGKQDRATQMQRKQEMRNSASNGRRPLPRKTNGKNDSTRPPKNEYKRVERVWMTLSLGKETGMSTVGDVISILTQTGGIKKKCIGKVKINDQHTDFELNTDLSDGMIESFTRRKKEPKAEVKLQK